MHHNGTGTAREWYTGSVKLAPRLHLVQIKHTVMSLCKRTTIARILSHVDKTCTTGTAKPHRHAALEKQKGSRTGKGWTCSCQVLSDGEVTRGTPYVVTHIVLIWWHIREHNMDRHYSHFVLGRYDPALQSPGHSKQHIRMPALERWWFSVQAPHHDGFFSNCRVSPRALYTFCL